MEIRPAFNEDRQKKANDELDALVRRLYTVWLLGIAWRVLELSFSKASFAGIEITLAHPDLIPGFIFLFYVHIISLALVIASGTSVTTVPLLRTCVYMAAGRGRTLRKSTRDIRVIKLIAKAICRFFGIARLVYLFLLGIQILAFEHSPLLKAIRFAI